MERERELEIAKKIDIVKSILEENELRTFLGNFYSENQNLIDGDDMSKYFTKMEKEHPEEYKQLLIKINRLG